MAQCRPSQERNEGLGIFIPKYVLLRIKCYAIQIRRRVICDLTLLLILNAVIPVWYVWRSRLDHQHPTGDEWRLRMILLAVPNNGLNATTIFAQWHMPGIDMDLVSQELSTLMKFRVRSGNEPMSRFPIRFSRVSQERVSAYIEPSVSVKDIEFPIPDMPSKGELPCCHYALVR